MGNKMPDWIRAGFAEYAKRFPPSCRFELIEIPIEKRFKDAPEKRLMDLEGKKLLSKLKPGHRVIALEVKGKMWSTEQLADQIKQWQITGQNIDMLIGGPDGLSEECIKKADVHWSLSPLTLPHPLVRVLVAEQLYRAVSILQNHPYHR
jgi:23S rRNA (pseudouridine1915-N3)-methyltransferase